MSFDDAAFGQRLRELLRPFASSFSGSLGRGDLVIPRAEIEKVVRDLLEIARGCSCEKTEASEHDLFQLLSETRRLGSVQEQMARLRERFVVLERR
jgi:hypothetical protein